MKIKLSNIKVPLDVTTTELKNIAIKKLNIKNSDCLSFKIARQSIDARKKNVSFVYTVILDVKDGTKIPEDVSINKLPTSEEVPLEIGSDELSSRPLIVGAGPCGLFCALTLARHGYRPLVLERGSKVDERTDAVYSFWEKGILDKNTNVQFGEGGAGTFSDGKLTTRINDPSCDSILEDFVKFGAPSEILYKAKPHIGTDILSSVVRNMRNEIISLGGDFMFNTKLEKICKDGGKISSVITSSGDEIACDVLLLCIGHSARDTYKMLFENNIDMVLKPFSVGVRVEHLQDDIDKAMYGDFAHHPLLGASSYQLSYINGNDRCYSFCMCPGGYVVAAASEENSVVTNGMSNFRRDNKNSNAALCVNVDKTDFGSENPMAGVIYQQKLEQNAFLLGGSNYHAPVQKVGDFLNNKPTFDAKRILPSYTGGVSFCSLKNCLPEKVSRVLGDAIKFFGTKIQGFDDYDVLFTGVETRTSAPVRILRDSDFESTSLSGLYPCGEGAGYAGGIMSAACDGLNAAKKVMKKYKPF